MIRSSIIMRDAPFQSTPSTRRETSSKYLCAWHNGISIHSLHTEGDTDLEQQKQQLEISIHSLHTEGDLLLSS